jgi:hypothetical protein
MVFPMQGQVGVSPGVLVRELEGESVLLNLSTESYFGLDEVGTRMWAALLEAPSIQAAYEQLLAEYDVDPGQLQSDLCQLIERLRAEGLIEVRGA